MATILKAIPFDEDLLPLVLDFNCAEKEPAEPWEEEINEWIRLNPSEGDGALFYIQKGTQVWLYTNEKDEVVGYGSLGESKWPDPAVLEKVPKLKRVPVSVIPAVGINRRFQSGPDGATREERYSTKIMNHLVFEARKHPSRQPFLCLHVHPENVKAIQFYRRMSFIEFHKKYHDEESGVDYPSFVLKLTDYPPTTEG